MKEKLGEEEIAITRPTTMAEIRIYGLDESVTMDEIKSIVVNYGDCSDEEIRIGQIKWMYNGLGMTWVRCPLATANKMAKDGRIRIGWTVARVEILAKRPLQCYRCWEFGHVRFSCSAKVDRQGHCYNCGIQGHSAKACNSREPRCILCEERRQPANHRIGSRFCSAIKTTERTNQLPRRKLVEVGKDAKEIKTHSEERIGEVMQEEKMEYIDEK